MNQATRIAAVKTEGRGRVGYVLVFEGREYPLVRSIPRPERLYPVDEKLNATKVDGVKWFSDESGELIGLTG